MIKDVTTIAVDLAKDVFQVAYGDGQGRVLSRQRIGGRRAFALQIGQWRDVVVVMESCATAHYWGRECQRLGLRVRLLPAQHVGAYRRRNKTGAADAEALLEAARNAQIKDVPVKNETQQLVLAVHSLREGWKAEKMEKAIEHMLDAHRRQDAGQNVDTLTQREQQQIETLTTNSRKIREWLAVSPEKTNRRGEPLKSNLTDNDSATMKTSHGVVQGYTGVAAVDAKTQVVVHASAFGIGQENGLLPEVRT